MRAWSLLVPIVLAALATMLTIAYAFPGASSAVFLIGTPIVVVGASLGARFVSESRKRRRARP